MGFVHSLVERQCSSCSTKVLLGSSLRWPRPCAEPLEHAAADHPPGDEEEDEGTTEGEDEEQEAGEA